WVFVVSRPERWRCRLRMNKSTHFHAKGQSHSESIAERDTVAHHATLLSERTGVASQRETSHVADSRTVRRSDARAEARKRSKSSVSADFSASFRRFPDRSIAASSSPHAGNRRAFPPAG